ncbi:hypothetical protein B0H10DRAFT_2191713 [Mycena sp. CBHHK59/15]|nr:hypothetical protein B0H10DRAFT_2191713 [Mycena sp. CBHHK59/15]
MSNHSAEDNTPAFIFAIFAPGLKQSWQMGWNGRPDMADATQGLVTMANIVHRALREFGSFAPLLTPDLMGDLAPTAYTGPHSRFLCPAAPDVNSTALLVLTRWKFPSRQVEGRMTHDFGLPLAFLDVEAPLLGALGGSPPSPDQAPSFLLSPAIQFVGSASFDLTQRRWQTIKKNEVTEFWLSVVGPMHRFSFRGKQILSSSIMCDLQSGWKVSIDDPKFSSISVREIQARLGEQCPQTGGDVSAGDRQFRSRLSQVDGAGERGFHLTRNGMWEPGFVTGFLINGLPIAERMLLFAASRLFRICLAEDPSDMKWGGGGHTAYGIKGIFRRMQINRCGQVDLFSGKQTMVLNGSGSEQDREVKDMIQRQYDFSRDSRGAKELAEVIRNYGEYEISIKLLEVNFRELEPELWNHQKTGHIKSCASHEDA